MAILIISKKKHGLATVALACFHDFKWDGKQFRPFLVYSYLANR